MARRAFDERNIRTLLRFAKRSIAITLPIEVVRDLGWQEHQRVRVRKAGKRIVIEGETEDSQ